MLMMPRGAVSNTGLVLNKLGIRTQLMGKVGNDLFGQAVRQIVASYGADLAGGMLVDDRASTSYTVIINLPEVDRIFLHCPGANDTFCADDVRYDLLAGPRLFHFGYPPIMRQMYTQGGLQLAEIPGTHRPALNAVQHPFTDREAVDGRAGCGA